jgi:alginate O-acetyltransferase complex protein AlgI
MLFNSLAFCIFLPLVFAVYWYSNKSLRLQNIVLAIASYVFYGWWDYRFLVLIFVSTLVDYFVSLGMERSKNKKRRKSLLGISVVFNLGLLGYYKYANFFIDSLVDSFQLLGLDLASPTLNVILPVGISFYTFQTLSYSIDVYRGDLKANNNFLAFMVYVGFFPQLVAGPIERSTKLLPQILNKRTFDYQEAVLGMKQILWGLFKKMVIADNCAPYVNEIFNSSENLHGSTLLLGAILFSFQIYGDFSGYSDIAIGVSRLFGIKLTRNFHCPYFSRDIAEFWRRWHISLSSWFRDYVYIPLGGSAKNRITSIKNIFTIFLISGFWHGANWTFIAWGAFHSLLYLPLFLLKRNRKNLSKHAGVRDGFSIVQTYLFVCIGWVFFRAKDINHAMDILMEIMSRSLFSPIQVSLRVIIVLALIILLISLEWMTRKDDFALAKLGSKWNTTISWSFYSSLLFIIVWFAKTGTSFIYFQF